VVHPQDDYGPNHCYEQAIDVQAAYAVGAEHIEEESSNNRAYDPEDDIQKHTFPALIHDLATYEPGD